MSAKQHAGITTSPDLRAFIQKRVQRYNFFSIYANKSAFFLFLTANCRDFTVRPLR